jgi:hypothetical protein
MRSPSIRARTIPDSNVLVAYIGISTDVLRQDGSCRQRGQDIGLSGKAADFEASSSFRHSVIRPA